MTCIAAIVDKGKVYIGGDSAGVNRSLNITTRSDKKVFINNNMIMGFTSSYRLGQLLQYKFSPPSQNAHKDDMAYMVSDFIDAVRKCFEDNGFSDADNEKHGGIFLVGYKGRLYKIGQDYQVGEAEIGFDACGCGQDIALGSMYSTKTLKPEARITKALEAATQFSAGVRPPFLIKSL